MKFAIFAALVGAVVSQELPPQVADDTGAPPHSAVARFVPDAAVPAGHVDVSVRAHDIVADNQAW